MNYMTDKCTGLKIRINYTASENDEARKAGEAGDYSSEVDFSNLTPYQIAQWAVREIKTRTFQPMVKKGKMPPKFYTAVPTGTRSITVMTDETALMQFARGDQATYDRWVEKYGSATEAVKQISEFMNQLRSDHK